MTEIAVSKRVQGVQPSPTLAITAQAAELRAAGNDVIGLGAGEPDFDTPDHIKAAGIDAINNGQTRYTAVDGTPALKAAVIAKFKRDNGLDYQADQILVSSGGKQSFFNLAQALLNAGDEVIIPAPYWVSYPDMVLLAEGKPVIIETGMAESFKVRPEQLAAAITDRTRLFVLNSPSNPSGIAYSKVELAALGDVLRQHPNIVIATDDMYEHIIWNDEGFVNILNACPDLYGRTMVLNGVSKAYAMTGWRIGYAGGPSSLVKKMKIVQSQSTSNPSSVSQAAAVAALDGDQSCIVPMLKAFKQRHDFVFETLNQMQGVKTIASDGTFYSFPDFSEVIANSPDMENDLDLAAKLLDEAGVALVPGTAFGSPGYVRISFATSLEVLEDALNRIRKTLDI